MYIKILLLSSPVWLFDSKKKGKNKMNSKNKKQPPISHIKLFLLYIVFGVILHFVLGIFLDDFILESAITLIVVLPIYSYFYIKYFHKPFIRWEIPKKRGITPCPYHPDNKTVTHCKLCKISICERCQRFKTEMRNVYKHNFRINHRLFDQSICMDCIFKKLNILNKILLVSGPGGFVIGLSFILIGYYIVFLPFNLFLIFGILISILGIILFILALIINKENNKLIANFHQF